MSLHLDIRRNDIDTEDTTTCRSSDVTLSHLRHIYLAGDIVLVLTLFGTLTFPSVCEVYVRGTSSDHPIDPFISIFQCNLTSHFATLLDVRFSHMQLNGVGVFDRANHNAVVFTSPVGTESQALPPIFSLEWDELYKYGDTGNEDMDPSLLAACIKGHPSVQAHSATIDANVLHSYPYISDAPTHGSSGSMAFAGALTNWFAPLLALPALTVITLEGMNFEAPPGPINYNNTSSLLSHLSSPTREWEDTETPHAILESFWHALVERLQDKEELELVVRRCEIARGRIQDTLHAVGSNTWRVDWDGEEWMVLSITVNDGIDCAHVRTADRECSYFDYTFSLFWHSLWTIAPVIGIGLFHRLIDERVIMASANGSIPICSSCSYSTASGHALRRFEAPLTHLRIQAFHINKSTRQSVATFLSRALKSPSTLIRTYNQ
ncbi:hypothetical protein PENSPDRAFT_672047 [Peniophora sp. CONT]|nr:hypothetical protein PENSPDRAFT_672047 [Peniophora sp. CONT]